MEFAGYRESIDPVAARQIIGQTIPSCWCFFAQPIARGRFVSFPSSHSRAIVWFAFAWPNQTMNYEQARVEGEFVISSRENMNFFCEHSRRKLVRSRLRWVKRSRWHFVQAYLLSSFEHETRKRRRQVSSNSTRVKVFFSKHLRLIERVIER